MLSSITCEICSGASSAWLTVNGYRHYRCGCCKHVFVWPRPDQSVLHNVYANDGYYADAEQQVARLLKQARQRLGRLEEIAARKGLARKLLEIGCADGQFLRVARSRGWDVAGVERSHALALRARLNANAPIHEGLVEDLDASETFPVIYAWEVLEHMLDPGAFLASMARRLSPEGVLALSTPMIDGLVAGFMGSRYPMIMPPEHLSLFSRRSLTLLGGKSNLEVIHFSSFSHIGTRSLASGLSRILLGRELAQVPAFGRGVLMAGASLTAWIPKVVDAVGLGTEMEVFFRRRTGPTSGSTPPSQRCPGRKSL